jgi:hypothetical protein
LTIFMQGMRRSGTTISYDLFCADGSLDTFYEPLAQGKPKIGGGSGAQKVDVFESVRQARQAFLHERDALELEPLLNHGAPRRADLEFERQLPPLVRDYLAYLVTHASDPLLKFTRMYCKVPLLYQLDPDAKFVHVVRDPRAVAASYLFGPGHKHKKRFLWKRRFFAQTRKTGHWAAHRLAARLVLDDEFRHLQGCPDYVRVMLVWKFVFRETYHAARELFGDRYFLLRHEDLACDPENTLERLYSTLERPLPGRVVDWARSTLRAPGEPFQASHPAWRTAIEGLSLADELELAGYTDLLRPGATAGATTRGLGSGHGSHTAEAHP